MIDAAAWRCRIGVIYMASSTVMEPELYAMAPSGVGICTTRTRLPKMDISGLEGMIASDDVERCTGELAKADLHVILYGGTSASFLKGVAGDRQLTNRMAALSHGIPVSTTSSAAVAALRALDARRVSFIGPYVSEITNRGRQYLSEHGFEVLAAAGMEVDDDLSIGRISQEAVYEFVRRNVSAASDAVLISCTNLQTIGAIEPLEEDLGIPVVSANQSSLWHCLKVAGVKFRVTGFGRLFAR